MCTAINAITMALMHAGVAMSDMIVACSSGRQRQRDDRILHHGGVIVVVLSLTAIYRRSGWRDLCGPDSARAELGDIPPIGNPFTVRNSIIIITALF